MSEHQTRYRTVLKASSLIGGASMINILIGMVKIKFVAVLLGPEGIGLLKVYNSIIQPVSTLAGLGLHTSGVRQIATANGAKDEEKVSKVVRTLCYTCWFTGALGALAMIALSPWLSQWTFGSRDHTLPIAILGSVVLITNISQAQKCIIQGKRRIKDLAKMQILGALNGTLISVPMFYLYKEKGIVPSLILFALAGLITSWWYSRKISLVNLKLKKNEVKKEVNELIGFGIPLMFQALQIGMFGYFIKLLIMNRFGAEGVGLWAAAFTISGILVNFVLQSIGADYYPKLAGLAHKNDLMFEEVNTQTHIVILLALPGLTLTMLYAPAIINILYSESFNETIPILKWSIFGSFGKVLMWPSAYIMLAKGLGKTTFSINFIGNIINFTLIYFLTQPFGLEGAGIARAISIFFHLFLNLGVAYWVSGYKLDIKSIKWGLVSFIFLIISFTISSEVQNIWIKHIISLAITATVCIICLSRLKTLTGIGINTFLEKFKNEQNKS